MWRGKEMKLEEKVCDKMKKEKRLDETRHDKTR